MEKSIITILLIMNMAFTQTTFDTTIYVGNNPFSIDRYDIDSLEIVHYLGTGPDFHRYYNYLSWRPGEEVFYIEHSLNGYKDLFLQNGDTVRSGIDPIVFEYMGGYVLIQGLNMIYNDSTVLPDSITFRFTEDYSYTSIRSRYTGRQYFRDGGFNLLGRKREHLKNYSEILLFR